MAFTVGNETDPSAPGAKVWPFAVDWSENFGITLSFQTDVWGSRSGQEQRRANRSTPRKTLSFSSLVADAELRALRALLNSDQNKTMVMPDVTKSVMLTEASPTGFGMVVVDRLHDWLTPGALVVMTTADQREIRKVDSANGLIVTFVDTSDIDWPEGAEIHPGLKGTLAGSLRSSFYSDSVARVGVTFNVTPLSEPQRDPGAPFAMFAGREVLTVAPNWRNGIDIDSRAISETVDYGRGAVATFLPVEFGTQVFGATYLALSAEEIDALELFFRRAKGRRGEFYMSTGVSDLQIASAAPAGSSFLRVVGQDTFASFKDDTVHRAIEVVLEDDTRIYRKLAAVNAMTTVSDAIGSDTLIQVSEPWPRTLIPADVLRISWLPVCRFAGDELNLEYLTNEVGQVQFSIQTLQDRPAE
jgi:hypothetical protein